MITQNAVEAHVQVRRRCLEKPATKMPSDRITTAHINVLGSPKPEDNEALTVPDAALVRPVVLTVTENTRGELPLTVTLVGIEQVARTGAPLQARLTEPLKPLNGFTSRLYVAVCPAE